MALSTASHSLSTPTVPTVSSTTPLPSSLPSSPLPSPDTAGNSFDNINNNNNNNNNTHPGQYRHQQIHKGSLHSHHHNHHNHHNHYASFAPPIARSPVTASSGPALFRQLRPEDRSSSLSSLASNTSAASLSTDSLHRPSPSATRNSSRHRQSISSAGSVRTNKAALLSLAALARDKTSSAIASLSLEPSVKTKASSSSLHRPTPSTASSYSSSPRLGPTLRESEGQHQPRPTFSRTVSSLSQNSTLRSPTPEPGSPAKLSRTNPPSQAYDDTDANTPAPTLAVPAGNLNKMHQTSSRLLRMTDDDRPFTRDFKDLFATLVVSLPLAQHRIRLTRVEHSFWSEEAINNLGSLKFSQSNRMPDPKDPSRIVTTTTTTTFSMAREMARSVCQRFLDARFIESADGKQAKEFLMKGMLWQLSPKGIHVLERFCAKNGIQQKHISELISSPKNTMQLVILERDTATDKLSSDRSTIEVIFRRFIGQNGPNLKNSTTSADSDSLSDYKDGIAGVKMANERKVGSPPRMVYQTFTGKAATDWLMDCCTTVDRRETTEIAALFLEQDLIWCVQQDRGHVATYPHETKFQPTRHAIYQMTQHGKDVVNLTSRDRSIDSESLTTSGATRAVISRDSNTQKLEKILNDAALRLLFRENLRDTHCEENLSFYLDVEEFLKSCRQAIKSASTGPRPSKSAPNPNLDATRETMASAYGIYNAFLAPGSPCELNIDHMLRNMLATRMTKAVGQDSALIESLREVSKLFEEAQLSVFKLMASDSVPKFMKSAKYEQTLKNYDFDSIAGSSLTNQPRYSMPERSVSRSRR